MKHTCIPYVLIIVLSIYASAIPTHCYGQQKPPPAIINVDLAKEKGSMTPIWAWFGYDEPNYTYMKDGKKLLSEIAALSPVPVYVRAHSLLCTGDGTPALKWGSTNAYTEDANGNQVYNWKSLSHRLVLCRRHYRSIHLLTSMIGSQGTLIAKFLQGGHIRPKTMINGANLFING